MAGASAGVQYGRTTAVRRVMRAFQYWHDHNSFAISHYGGVRLS